jgi:hypothetical protein
MARRLLPLFLLMAFLFAACSPAAEPATLEPVNENPTKTPVVEDEPAAPTAAATESASPAEPVQATVEPPDTAQPQPTELPTEPTATELPPTEVAVFNGAYENTYFRGSETAPVTLIDYSDFL